MIDYLTNDVARRRQAGETVAVLFVDLDGLKQLNDTYGHQVGERPSWPRPTHSWRPRPLRRGRPTRGRRVPRRSLSRAQWRRQAVAAVTSLARQGLPVRDFVVPLRASVGVALTRCDTDTDPMELVRQADAAMYEAKRAACATRALLATPL